MITLIKIHSIEDLRKEITKIANSSITLAKKCYFEKKSHY